MNEQILNRMKKLNSEDKLEFILNFIIENFPESVEYKFKQLFPKLIDLELKEFDLVIDKGNNIYLIREIMSDGSCMVEFVYSNFLHSDYYLSRYINIKDHFDSGILNAEYVYNKNYNDYDDDEYNDYAEYFKCHSLSALKKFNGKITLAKGNEKFANGTTKKKLAYYAFVNDFDNKIINKELANAEIKEGILNITLK